LAQSVEQLQLQALGLEGVQFSPMTLARAYRKIALSSDFTLRRGLERAVLEGTAQWAAPQGLPVAGKTGTTNEGAWFAGYAPVHDPRVIVTVFVAQGRGGSDAAPVAREILEWWRKSEFSP
jgi:penicillin-binding protein 2